MNPGKAKVEAVVKGPTTAGVPTPNSGPTTQEKVHQDPVVEKLQKWRENVLQHVANEKEWVCTELITMTGSYGIGKATIALCTGKNLKQNGVLKIYGANPKNAIYVKNTEELSAIIHLFQRLVEKREVIEKVVEWAESGNGKVTQRAKNGLELEL